MKHKKWKKDPTSLSGGPFCLALCIEEEEGWQPVADQLNKDGNQQQSRLLIGHLSPIKLSFIIGHPTPVTGRARVWVGQLKDFIVNTGGSIRITAF